MTPQPAFDFAHTTRAETNRHAKAHRLAVAARSLGLQPYDIAPIGGLPGAAEQRARVRRLAQVPADPSVETWQVTLAQLEGLARSIPGTGPCPLCGWAVLTLRTEAGRVIRLDPFPHGDGTAYPVATKDSGPRVRVLAASSPRPDDEPLFRQHDPWCPSRRPQAPQTAPTCSVCHRPLDEAMAARDASYTSHPTCDPREGGAT